MSVEDGLGERKECSSCIEHCESLRTTNSHDEVGTEVNKTSFNKDEETRNKKLWDIHSSTIFTVLNMGIYASLGCILRVYIGKITVGITSKETAIFEDLPANMLGCFLMGFLTFPTKNVAHKKILWLSSSHYFQNWTEIHFALRTGFCGSLTTFSSWNAQMVIMLHSLEVSQIISAFLGYIIGLQSSLMSLKFGQNLSYWLYCHFFDTNNKNNTNSEEDIYRSDTWKEVSHEKEEENKNKWKNNSNNPDEDIYRSDTWEETSHEKEEDENKWKINSIHPEEDIYRSDTWEEISEKEEEDEPKLNEKAMLDTTANDDSFDEFMGNDNNAIVEEENFMQVASENQCSSFFQWIHYFLPWLLLASFFAIFILGKNDSFLKHLLLSSSFAPFSACLRWKLCDTFNPKSQNKDKNWFPWGTFTANVLGSFFCILAMGILILLQGSSLEEEEGYSWTVDHLLQSSKTGFAGCLSTVSTFINEIDALTIRFPKQAKSYKYAYGTIFTSCIISICIYSSLIRLPIPDQS